MSSHLFAKGAMAPIEDTPPPVNQEEANWRKIIREHGGVVADPENYNFSRDGFSLYLEDSGLSLYDGDDLIAPHNSSAARGCGYQHLLPQKNFWSRGAALALWAQASQRATGVKRPYLRNWYRPTCYNSRVGGASGSDHIDARGIDLDYRSSSERRRVQKWLCQYYASNLNMQIGLGYQAIHLGAHSPKGKRNWFYGSYSDGDRGRTCFD